MIYGIFVDVKGDVSCRTLIWLTFNGASDNNLLNIISTCPHMIIIRK
jgi:hypothetical protein